MDEEKIYENLKSQDGSKRAEAVKELGLKGEKEAFKPLIKALKDQDEHVRANAALALGNLGDPSAIKYLEAALKDDSWLVRHDAMSSLGLLSAEPDEVIPLLEDHIPEVKAKAVETLGHIGGKKALKAVIDHMGSNGITLEVAEALEKFDDIETRDSLIVLYKKGDTHIREIAIRALSGHRDKAVFDIMVKALKDKSWRVKEEAISALGEMENRDALPHLQNCLKSDNVFILESTLKSMAELGGLKDTELVREMLGHQEPAVAAAAAKVLGRSSVEEDEDLLISTLLDGGHPLVLWSVVDALGELRRGGDTSKMRTALKEADEQERYMLAIALGNAGDERALEDLLHGMVHESWKIRQKSVEALGRISTDDIAKNKLDKLVNVMIESLEDTDRWVRAAAALYLGNSLKDTGLQGYHHKVKEKLKERYKQEIDDDVKDVLKKFVEG